MLVLVPGGLVAVALYPGKRRAEVTATVLLAWLFFSVYSYAGQNSGLGAFVLGVDTSRWSPPHPGGGHGRSGPGGLESGEGLAGDRDRARSSLVTYLVHPLAFRWSEQQAKLVRIIYATTRPEAVLITEPFATEKFFTGVYEAGTVADRTKLPWSEVPALLWEPVRLCSSIGASPRPGGSGRS